MQKIQIRRTKNLWVPLKGNFCTPCAVWDLDLEQLEALIDIGVRKKIASCLVKTEDLGQQTSLKIKDLLALTAAKLQSCDSDEVFAWLMDISSRHTDQRFCYSFVDEKVATRVGPLTVDCLLKINSICASDKASDWVSAESLHLIRLYRQQVDAIGPTLRTLRLLIEAAGRLIPFMRHSDRVSYQLGNGSQRKLINNGYTSNTSQLATNIATHKYLAASVMGQASLPVPKHIVVRTFEEAQVAAERVKFPVVMKPTSTDKGVGVTVGIENNEELKFAWSQAAPYGNVLIEQMLYGLDHRLHVVDGKCIYVIRRTPPYVVGNGIDTLERLLSLNAMERASHPIYKKYGNVSLTDAVVKHFMEKNGLLPSSVIEAGKTVYLRSNSNVSTGGSFEDVTEKAHPDNILLAERAARIVGLDNAGIDFITTDISKSWAHSTGGICEINPNPGVLCDSAFTAILNYLFPKPRTGRVPTILLVGDHSALNDFCTLLINAFRKKYRTYGFIYDRKLNVSSSNGVFIAPGGKTQDLLASLLSDELVESAFIQLGFEEMRAGLDLHYIDLLVAIGTESEMSFIQQSDLMSRCNQVNVLTNPTIGRFQDAINELFSDKASL
jgi:D-alanine-D-alanine ligase-like ATP-grasp enzyme